MSASFAADALQKLLPLGRGVRVLAAGPLGLVALEKPCETRSHPNAGGPDKGALLTARYDMKAQRYFWKGLGEGTPESLWLLNRLDAPTSGVVLACLEEKTIEAARACFADGTAEKVYYALVKGQVRPPAGLWRDRLARQASERGVRMGTGAALEAVSGYETKGVSSRHGKISLLRLTPQTGRTHQLRVQCTMHGHPILGDRTYGDFAWNRQFAAASGEKRLFLHCAATRLTLKVNGQTVRFSAQCPAPESFSGL